MKLEKDYLKRLIFALTLVLFLTGCANTIMPKSVESNQPSFSENGQNSGFIDFLGNDHGIVTAGAREKYNLLIDIYSKDFLPNLKADFGIIEYTNKTYLITLEGLSNFATMNRWYKDGKPGKK